MTIISSSHVSHKLRVRAQLMTMIRLSDGFLLGIMFGRHKGYALHPHPNIPFPYDAMPGLFKTARVAMKTSVVLT